MDYEVKKKSIPLDEDGKPGSRVRAFRLAAGMSQRELSQKCDPPMDFTAVGRIEHNKGFTSATLNRLAVALECGIEDFFLPADIIDMRILDETDRAKVITFMRKYVEIAQQKKKLDDALLG